MSQYRKLHENASGWVRIPRRSIHAKFRNAAPSRLEVLGLIDISRHYTPGKQSRGYRVNSWVLEGFIEAESLDDSSRNEPQVSIINGKPLKTPTNAAVTIAKDSVETNELPQLVEQAIHAIHTCYFNRPAVIVHLKRLRASYRADPTISNRFRYLNDRFVYDAINQYAEPVDGTPDIYHFTPSYRMQATGRIGTPLQNASRSMKQAAYTSIPNLHNYDLASSQMALCLHEFERHGIECPWLETYLRNTGMRDEHAQYVAVSIDTWKKCLYTLLMTGYLPTNIKWQGSPIVEALAVEHPQPEALKGALSRFREVAKPLTRALNAWQKQIKATANESGKLINMLGIQRPIASFTKSAEMVAHVLQGMEAYFIHTLTTLSTRYGFEVIGNEHDGLITLNKIPEEAIRETQRLTGLHCLELREKPFNG